MKVKVGISNRHVHLKKEHLEILFGANYSLKILREIVQPNQYASTDTITIKTAKGEIKNVRILGPLRDYTQVEISKTDSYKLGINPPIRESGDIKGSEAITIIGPVGEIDLKEGCIIANRHIHLNSEDMKKLNLKDKKEVSIKVPGVKGGILSNVSLKESDDSILELHLDVDDANAHLISTNDELEIIFNKNKK